MVSTYACEVLLDSFFQENKLFQMFPLFFTFHNLRTKFGCDYKLWQYFFQINIFPEWANLILYLFPLNDFSW